MSRLPRIVEPEILDSLPPDDPLAVKGRRDLRRINFLMGNARWILRQVSQHPAARRGIVELGAGDGDLLMRLAAHGPATGCDLAPRPTDLPENVTWLEGDLFSRESELEGGVLVVNLFLHHLEPADLARLGAIANRFSVLLFVEPHRSRLALGLAGMLLPFVSAATRHDMPVSIRAGFIEKELPEYLGLFSAWRVRERSTWRGALRVLATRES